MIVPTEHSKLVLLEDAKGCYLVFFNGILRDDDGNLLGRTIATDITLGVANNVAIEDLRWLARAAATYHKIPFVDETE
jgi:hypothetical protein